MYFAHTIPPSVLAFITTLHLAFAALRAHRSAAGLFAPAPFASLLLAGSPWLMPSIGGVVIGVLAHACWFAVCEQFLVPATMVPARVAPSRHAAAPAASPRRSSSLTTLARKPPQFVQTPVMAVFNETPDTRTFRMARPEGFDFKAGQFLTVRVRADGKDHVRCYSISSSPDARGHLEITVKRHGLVSGTLHATVRPGSLLSVRAPAGAFVYPAADDRALVLIAGGVGITPLMSMLRHALDTEPTRPVTLIYSVKSLKEVVFNDEISWLDSRHQQLRVVITITGDEAVDAGWRGRITSAMIASAVPDIVHAVCCVCGPAPMIDAVRGALTTLGVPKTQINHEIFEPAAAASAGRTPARAAAEVRPGAGFELQFTRSGVSATVGADDTVLEASEGCGAAIPSLCRAGVCGTCRTRVLSGEVDCASQILDDQDRQEGYVLACVSRVRSDCHVEA